MKQVKIGFTGFWPGFLPDNNCFTSILQKRYHIEISDRPDYIFCSCFSKDYLQYDGIRIYYTGECLAPDFNVFDYAIGYDYIEFGDRYLRMPNYFLDEYAQDVRLMLTKHQNNEDILERKTEFCSFVVSKGDGYVDACRERFFHSLCKYKKVNSGGKFLNNIGEPAGVGDKQSFQLKHKFAIAFENTSHLGYSTEKIVQAFAAKTIPIYWGDPMIGNTFNTGAFINCHDFSSFEDVIAEVRRIDEDDQAYCEMINTPALFDQDFIGRTRDNLERFLVNIFDHDYEEMYRRDKAGYGEKYADELRQNKKKRTRWFGR